MERGDVVFGARDSQLLCSWFE